jgi:ABC-type Zn uptake system ZnuABC Zn-binding protein ZnuA
MQQILKMSRVPLLHVLILLLALWLSACAASATPTGSKPIIVATTTQLEDVLNNIVGDRMTVVGLVPRNGDVHTFEPTPDDVRKVATAQAVFKNGAGLEGWLDKLIANAGGQRPIFDTTQGLPLATIDDAFDDRGQTDPHVWMSPVLMQGVVDNIVAGLKQIDPQGAAVYEANGSAYKTKLQELDVWTQQQVATIPPAQRQLVTTHDAMGYFAKQYGFKIIGYVIPSVSSEAQTSAKQLAELEAVIKSSGVKTIFAEKSINPKFMDQVAQDTNVRIQELYVDSLGNVGGEAGTYLDFFRTDVTRIVDGLK